MTEPAPKRYSPLDIGPWMVLPTGRLVGGMVVGAALASSLALAAVWFLRPTGVGAVPLAMLGAVAAHAVSIVSIRPWKPRFLGQWPFVVLRASAVSFLLVLVFLVLIYSATRPDPAVLGLAMVGAWFGGLLSLVAAYGSYVKGVPPESAPDRSSPPDRTQDRDA